MRGRKVRARCAWSGGACAQNGSQDPWGGFLLGTLRGYPRSVPFAVCRNAARARVRGGRGTHVVRGAVAVEAERGGKGVQRLLVEVQVVDGAWRDAEVAFGHHGEGCDVARAHGRGLARRGVAIGLPGRRRLREKSGWGGAGGARSVAGQGKVGDAKTIDGRRGASRNRICIYPSRGSCAAWRRVWVGSGCR